MNKFFIVLLFAFAACEADLDSLIFQQFQKFIKKFNKKYESMNEYLARYEVFKKMLCLLSEVKKHTKLVSPNSPI